MTTAENATILQMWQAAKADAEKAILTRKRLIVEHQTTLKTQEDGLELINTRIREIMARKGHLL